MQTPRRTETPDWVCGSSFYDYFSVFNGHRLSHYLATPWFDDFPVDGHLGCLWLFTFMKKYWCPEYPWIPIPAHLSNLFPQQTVSDGRLRLCNAHCYSVLPKVSFCRFPSLLPWHDRIFPPSSLKRLARRCSFNHCVSADAWCISYGKHRDRWDWARGPAPWVGWFACLCPRCSLSPRFRLVLLQGVPEKGREPGEFLSGAGGTVAPTQGVPEPCYQVWMTTLGSVAAMFRSLLCGAHPSTGLFLAFLSEEVTRWLSSSSLSPSVPQGGLSRNTEPEESKMVSSYPCIKP